MVKVLSDIIQNNNTKILFWVGCAGSFDVRIKKITKSFVSILKSINIDVYILGNEEKCSGDPAKRAGNEYLFEMLASENTEVFKKSRRFNLIHSVVAQGPRIAHATAE